MTRQDDVITTRLLSGSPTNLNALSRRLAVQANQAGLLDVGYHTMDTAIGQILVAATDAGVVRVAFETEPFDEVLEQLARSVTPRILAAPQRADPAMRQIEDYLEGRRHHIDVPVDLQLVHGFRRDVTDHLRSIDFGTTRSYGEVAAAIGHPRAFRAVGTACANNPIPLVIPCHRVIKSDGSPGSYLGGSATKTYLLNLESDHTR